MKTRVLVPELMDDPSIDPVEHRRALAGLRRVNTLCRTGKHVAAEILAVAKKYDRKTVRVLDLGCGSGDVACNVARRLAGQIEFEVVGWDISPTAVACANRSWSAIEKRILSPNQAAIHMEFEQVDVFSPREIEFDIVYCSLFLHHFAEPQAVAILKSMKKIAALSVLVDDLIRSRWGYMLAQIGCRFLSRSPVVHFDGPQSVRAAFTESEARRLAIQAGLNTCTVRRHWPERFLLRWDA